MPLFLTIPSPSRADPGVDPLLVPVSPATEFRMHCTATASVTAPPGLPPGSARAPPFSTHLCLKWEDLGQQVGLAGHFALDAASSPPSALAVSPAKEVSRGVALPVASATHLLLYQEANSGLKWIRSWK